MALLICMTEERDKVTGRFLKQAHDALQSDRILAFGSKFRRFFSKPALAGGALVLLLALGSLGYNAKHGENLKGRIYGPGPREVNTHVVKPPPPVPEVKSEEISKPPEAEGKNASTSMPGPVTPQAQGHEQESSKVLPKEGATKADTASPSVKGPSVKEPSVEGPGLNPAPSEETQAKDQIPDAKGKAAQGQGRDEGRKIAAESENPGADAQNFQTGGKTSRPSDAFTITVQKGDTLTGIAEQWFPEDPESGQKSILSANPEIYDKNRITEGQILRIPGAKEEVNR